MLILKVLDKLKLKSFVSFLVNVQSLMVKYGNLVSVISLVVLFVYLMVTPPNKSNAAKGSKKRR